VAAWVGWWLETLQADCWCMLELSGTFRNRLPTLTARADVELDKMALRAVRRLKVTQHSDTGSYQTCPYLELR
jgi:hypothetical protein